MRSAYTEWMEGDENGPQQPISTVPRSSQQSYPSMGSITTFYLTHLAGPMASNRWESQGRQCSIGSHETNDLVIDDPTVSRFHCELIIEADGVVVRDLDSTNQTIVDGVAIREALLRGGSTITLGDTVLRFDPGVERRRIALSPQISFGSLLGQSTLMRACFATLERAAKSGSSVLLHGETGTGKELAASGIHEASSRRDRPFVVVDCSALPSNLLESELFGHERGAFTGADHQHRGIFETASSGTVFLDEIGEMPLQLQPKLLRVLQEGQIRRVGSNRAQRINVRVVAATHRDLRQMVNQGLFRPDLYYRLAVIRIALPPLRERPDDIPLLVNALLDQIHVENRPEWMATPEFLGRIRAWTWPGNVRELRNYLERCVVFDEPVPVNQSIVGAPVVDISTPFIEAKRRVVADFERAYMQTLMAQNHGNVASAAQSARIDRGYLYRILRRTGLLPGRE